MKTTQEWLAEVKSSPEKFNHWLQRQYVGEVLAAQRLEQLAEIVTPGKLGVIQRIAADEAEHAKWIGGLLKSRCIPLPEVTEVGARYWEPVLAQGLTVQQLLAAGAHAEEMRLVRIKAIVDDEDFPMDVRMIFSDIYGDEKFHAKAFAAAAGPEAIEEARGRHEQGLAALGLEI